MGTFDALRGRGEEAESMPGTAGLASDPADEVTDAELRDRAADYVLPGFLDREEATVALRDYFELADDDPGRGRSSTSCGRRGWRNRRRGPSAATISVWNPPSTASAARGC